MKIEFHVEDNIAAKIERLRGKMPAGDFMLRCVLVGLAFFEHELSHVVVCQDEKDVTSAERQPPENKKYKLN